MQIIVVPNTIAFLFTMYNGKTFLVVEIMASDLLIEALTLPRLFTATFPIHKEITI